MIAGETYTLEAKPGSGTAVRVNGQVVAQTKDTLLFGCLMHNYFGKSPVDHGLKPALLGQPIESNSRDLTPN